MIVSVILRGDTGESDRDSVFVGFLIRFLSVHILEDCAKDPVLERHRRDEICVDIWDLKSSVFVM